MFNFPNASSCNIQALLEFHDVMMVVLFFVRAFIMCLILSRSSLSHRNSIRAHELETAWTIFPAMFLVAVVVPSLQLLYVLDDARGDCVVKAVGRQWYWHYDLMGFEFDSYMDGLLDADNRLILIGPTILMTTSSDVLHSWTVPTIGVKSDAIPGRINKSFILSSRPGVFYGQCSEICGRNHRYMPISVECLFNQSTVLKTGIHKVKMLMQTVCVLFRVAFFTLMERKVLGYIQTRKGPNKPALAGILVPFADAIKLFAKEGNVYVAYKILYLLSPVLYLVIPLLLWVTYPSFFAPLHLGFSLLWFVCVSALGVFALLGAGWGSNSKYSFLGAVRAVAQSISYEVCLTITLLHYVAYYYFSIAAAKTIPLSTFIFYSITLLLLSSLAESNRTPFDFSEGESELVRGYNTEFSSVAFVLFFLSEYISIMYLSMMVSLLYNMSSLWDIFVFFSIWCFLFIWVRGTLPRFRYDHLIHLAWKALLPYSLCVLMVIV